MIEQNPLIGIDDMACYVPATYLDLQDLAAARNISYEKLSKGLGLKKMAFPDAHEDAATMAAEAISELMKKNKLRPEQIGRLYMGTESALDGAKPTATYAAEMVEQKLGGSFRQCDVVEMTFACIGAVDALQICLDWVAADEERIAVVVASDIAKYELGSTGEYTQGAGAMAMLIKWQPRLLAIPNLFGVSMKSEHDFFKPIRAKYTETPVFDGPFSNQCYFDRMTDAMSHFRQLAIGKKWFLENEFKALSDRWERMVFHLPYSFHAKRIFVEAYINEQKAAGRWEAFLQKNNLAQPEESESKEATKAKRVFIKSVSKAADYQYFINKKLKKSQRGSSEVGNVYAASIFFALMSVFESDMQEDSQLEGKRFGFVAYGSGSKSKVFEGVVQSGWKEVSAGFGFFKKLAARHALDCETYEALHKRTTEVSAAPKEGRFALESIGKEGAKLGARYYGRIRVNGSVEVRHGAEVLER